MSNASQQEHHETEPVQMPGLSMFVRLLAEHTAREMYAMANTAVQTCDPKLPKEELE